MKFLLVLSCALACAVAKPGVLAPAGVLAYSNIVPAAAGAIALGESPISYAAHASTAPVAVAAAPAVAYSAPAVTYSAPAVAYSAPAIAAAPAVAYSAPAIAAAPAVAYSAPAVAAAPAVAYSAPAVAAAPAVVAAAPAVGLKTQYHAQDELGQAAYGHSEPLQAHSAVQDAHGNKIGAYSYVAPNGQVIAAKYVADALGYRVASNALPVGPGVGPAPIADTPEVVAARAAHLAEVAAARSRVRRGAVAVGHVPASTAPLAVATPAVVAAHAPIAYSAPAVVAAPAVHAPIAYSAPAVHAAPIAYAAPVAYAAAAAPAVRAATLTTVVNNPGHAVSYRVD